MLVSMKLGADFSRECADGTISLLLLATHPLLPLLSRMILCQHRVSNYSRRNESSFTAPISYTRTKPQGWAIGQSPHAQGVEICRIVDMTFRESSFHALR